MSRDELAFEYPQACIFLDCLAEDFTKVLHFLLATS